MNNVDDTVKTIGQNQSFVNESNNDFDSDILLCSSLLDVLLTRSNFKEKQNCPHENPESAYRRQI